MMPELLKISCYCQIAKEKIVLVSKNKILVIYYDIWGKSLKFLLKKETPEGPGPKKRKMAIRESVIVYTRSKNWKKSKGVSKEVRNRSLRNQKVLN